MPELAIRTIASLSQDGETVLKSGAQPHEIICDEDLPVVD
jgi:hypothetical protein